MRSKKLSAALAAPACSRCSWRRSRQGPASATAPVGSGKASATKCVCGLGTGKKATGSADQARRDLHADPGRRLHDDRQDREGVLQVRQRQRRHQRPADPVHALHGAARPGAAGALAKKLVESDKVVGIVGNTSFTECGTNWKYYKSKGFTVIGAGVQAECFGTPTFVESNMGPRYSEHRRGAGARPRRGEVARRRLAGRRSPRTPTAACSSSRKRPGIPCKSFPSNLPVTDANSIVSSSCRPQATGGGVILDFTPETAPALMKAAIAQGLIDKVKWGSSTPTANTLMAEQFPQFDGKIFINSEFGLLDADTGPDMTLIPAIIKKYAPKIVPQASARWASSSASSRPRRCSTPRAPVTAKSLQQGGPGAEERQVGHPLQAVVLRQRAAVPHPEQHRHHRQLQERQGRLKEKCFAIQAVDPQLAQTRAGRSSST